MKLKWPPMVTVRPDLNTIYRKPGERLLWSQYSVSIVVPPSATVEAGQGFARIKSEPPALEAVLSLHDYSDTIVSYWIDESFPQGGETLEPVEPRQTHMDVVSRRFASHSWVGHKVRVDDPFRNGISASFTAPANRAGDLSTLLTRVVDSVRFVQFRPLARNAPEAVSAFLDCGAKTVEDLYRYIDRHFYLMQDDAIDPLRLLVDDFEKEGRQGASTLRQIWEVLKEARKLADEGTWDQTIADARTLQADRATRD